MLWQSAIMKRGAQTYFDWVSGEWSLRQLMLLLISANQIAQFLPLTNEKRELWALDRRQISANKWLVLCARDQSEGGTVQTEIMLTGEHQSCEGIIKINCRPLDQSELRKLDKNEKSLVITLSGASRGERCEAIWSPYWHSLISNNALFYVTEISSLFWNTCSQSCN